MLLQFRHVWFFRQVACHHICYNFATLWLLIRIDSYIELSPHQASSQLRHYVIIFCQTSVPSWLSNFRRTVTTNLYWLIDETFAASQLLLFNYLIIKLYVIFKLSPWAKYLKQLFIFELQSFVTTVMSSYLLHFRRTVATNSYWNVRPTKFPLNFFTMLLSLSLFRAFMIVKLSPHGDY